ncbi:MAG: 2-hydroxyhepta-2,4-diene-1,7-dioate isomerase [Pseudopedobacter saltans]|uniref:2-hydroxyhepta-2,4-diene-1,7-dioate isomerase n=1 Tax=Pseudopedobacter saltans TaxID=151895 RepID=A0A2W5G1U4_9SPHI|nr:MAG: 2-hydroxyhepta-2,4-diene-1,7-dioate isomerase [Pseudopedobacter saltans]
MKIICVGRNYVAHALELKNEVPQEPVLFIKPETSFLDYHGVFSYPDFTKDLHHECEIVLKVNKKGSKIKEEDALNHIGEISLGIDFTARDVQSKLKEKSLPWEKAKAFDNAAVLGDFIPFDEKMKTQTLHFTLKKNDETVQVGDSSLMIFPMKLLIANISEYFTLLPGDLIFTGTPAGVGPCAVGDNLVGTFENKEMFSFSIQ